MRRCFRSAASLTVYINRVLGGLERHAIGTFGELGLFFAHRIAAQTGS
jgi:hypothetical protein